MLYISVFCLAGVALVVYGDPCQSYRPLRNADQRLTTSVYQSGVAICDLTLAPGWYRVLGDSVGDIATSCPGQNKCSTRYPIWMEGSVPTVAEGEVTRQVKMGRGNCMVARTFNIKVKNCGTYRVYQLSRTSPCPSAYCFDESTTLPELNPVVEVYEDTASDPTRAQIGFRCNLGDVPADTQSVFDINWFIDDIPVTTSEGLTLSNIGDSALRQEQWENDHKMGFHVKCSARARNPETLVQGNTTISEPFFAGIEVTPKELTVMEGQTETISIRSTVPIGYDIGFDRVLNLLVWYDEEEDEKCHNGALQEDIIVSDELQLGKACGVSIPASDWMTPVTLKVTGYVDGLYNGRDRLKNIRLETPFDFSPVWNRVSVPDVKVKIVDRDIEIRNLNCGSTNDPHMGTFDRLYWENHRSGEFVLYRHKHFPIQVHAAYRRCIASRAAPTCNCGLAIKSYHSLFVINMCGTGDSYSAGSFSNYLSTRNCDDTSMIITGSNPYTITLPTGTKVKFYVYEFSNYRTISYIYISPSSTDIENTDGLCGYLNSDRTDDFVLRNGTQAGSEEQFANDWKIPCDSDESLFRPDVQFGAVEESIRTYCSCARDSADFTNLENEVNCNLTQATTQCTTRKNDVLDDVVRTCEQYGGADIDISTTTGATGLTCQDLEREPANPIVRREWQNDWTEDKAREHCMKILRDAPAFGKCTQHLKIDAASFLDDCVKDIHMTGDGNWAQVELDAFKGQCELEAKKDLALGDTPGDDGSLLDNVLNTLCPNDCSGNGRCHKGNCHCNRGFIGRDCSVSAATPVGDVAVANDGVCDTSARPCKEIVVGGGNIPEGTNVTCRFRRFDVHDGTTVFQHAYQMTSALHMVPGVVRCPLPDIRTKPASLAYGYLVSLIRTTSVSTTSSDESDVFIYDTRFVRCDRKTYICSRPRFA